MNQLQAVKAEIERRIKGYDPDYTSAGKELEELLSFIGSLEKEPKVDLEKEIEWEWVHREKQEVSFIECAEMDKEEFVRFARHFYELGRTAK